MPPGLRSAIPARNSASSRHYRARASVSSDRCGKREKLQAPNPGDAPESARAARQALHRRSAVPEHVGDPEQEYFADGIVEDIITALSRFKSLFVIARNSSFTFKGRAVDIKEVGRRLGVRYVLEGSVRKASGKVRITGQLIDAVTGAHHMGGQV